jgi:hypothetical protein
MRIKIPTTVALLAALPSAVTGQLPQASAASLGLGYNMTASARGFAAVANNPAGLGHPGSPGFSLAVPAVAVETGVGPITLGDLVHWEGQLIPDAAKTEWLDRVTTAGAQAGTMGASATPLALSIGPVGLQLSAIAGGAVSLTPDAAELLLFGNAGRTGEPRDFDLDGSALDGYVLTTTALSFGLQVSPRLSLGVTGKYTVGNALIVGRDAGSLLSADPLTLQLDFPILMPPSADPGLDHGRGIGVDLGAIWQGPTFAVGATVQNLVNTFEWQIEGFSYLPGHALFEQDSTASAFDEQPATSAPASFLALAAGKTLEPVYSLGAEWRPSSLLRLQGDVRKRAAGGLELGPAFHAGVGAELQALRFLPLRAHIAKVSDGLQLGGGASLVLGPVNLSGAAAWRTGVAGDAVLGMLSLSFGAS